MVCGDKIDSLCSRFSLYSNQKRAKDEIEAICAREIRMFPLIKEEVLTEGKQDPAKFQYQRKGQVGSTKDQCIDQSIN